MEEVTSQGRWRLIVNTGWITSHVWGDRERSPNKRNWHERENVDFNSEYLESSSLTRTKETPLLS